MIMTATFTDVSREAFNNLCVWLEGDLEARTTVHVYYNGTSLCGDVKITASMRDEKEYKKVLAMLMKEYLK